jgi:TorA maturation chaperone TorD
MTEIDFDPALNMARQSLYRFVALSLLDPKAGSWERLDALRDDVLLSDAAGLIRNLPAAKPEKLGNCERPLSKLDPARILAQLTVSGDKFNNEYERTFGLLVSNACPPYETEYIDSKFTFQRSNTLADVSGFYRAFGLNTSDQHPDRPDHIVLELEYMAFLLGLERQADAGDSAVRRQRLDICRDAQIGFLREHLSWWAPAFAKLLAHENGDGYYAAVGVFLAALIPAERALLGVEVPAQPAAPSPMERPEACEGCQLTSH